MTKIVMLLAFFANFSALAAEAVPDEVQRLTSDFNKTMMVCPQKIWSDFKWDGLKVVLMYPSKAESWLWDASSNSLQKIANVELPASAIGSLYEFFDLGGHKAMSLNMETDKDNAFQFGVHEFFHYVGQEDWIYIQTGGRGTSYPMKGEPRLYRRMIYDNLKKYLLSGGKDHLGRAKYWFTKWSSEYVNETQSTTDGYEGTARYVDTMASAVAELGCLATDKQLKARVIQKVTDDFGFSLNGQHPALSREGYDLGGIAALVLRFSGEDLAEWNKRIVAGETPLQVLLESVAPVVDAVPEDLQNTFVHAAQESNKQRGKIIDADISNWNKKSYIRVQVPTKWLQSNFMPKFFVHSTELDLYLYPLYTEHYFIAPGDGGSKFQLNTNTVLFNHYSTVCSNQDLLTLVPEHLIKQEGRSAKIESDKVVGHFMGEIKTDEQGFKYFCLD